jgi:cell division protein ZapA
VAQLNIEVNGRSYMVGCEDGQEDHLRSLAALVDTQVRQVGQDVGQLGDTRLMLMGALLMADLYTDLQARIVALEAEIARQKAEHGRIELKAAAVIDAATQKIEALAV